jgi:hypothetical protein
MGFSISVDDFLNDFAAGFFFVLGMSVTNWKGVGLILSNLKHKIGDGYILLCFIFIYILGIIIYGIVYLISDICYCLEKNIENNKNKRYIKIICFLYKIFFYMPFRRWGIIGTFNRKMKCNELPNAISHLKSYQEFNILVHKISEKSKNNSMQFYSKSQFFQTSSDSILYVLIINIILYYSIQTYNLQTYSIKYICFICIPFIILFKLLSVTFADLHIITVARKFVALTNPIEKTEDLDDIISKR